MKAIAGRPDDGIVMPNATLPQFVDWRRKEGARLHLHRGRWWEEMKPGFYQGAHWLARYPNSEVERPAATCWGYRSTLRAADTAEANGSLPIHLLRELDSYDIATLPAKRRNKLRKAQKLNEIVAVRDPQILYDQGYRVRCAVTDRLEIWKPPSLEVYRAGLPNYLKNPCRLVLAGLHDGRLGGYLDAQAVEGTAYIDHVYLDAECNWTEVGTALVFELVQACRRAGSIHEIAYGLDTPSSPSLTEFKVKMGFPVCQVPTRHWIAPPMAAFIRWWRPEVYYRLTGMTAESGQHGNPVPHTTDQPA